LGQKVCPIGLRIGITKSWDSKWFAEKQKYTALLHEDMKENSTRLEFLKSSLKELLLNE
jgi:small subunit ribosomal protein S3